MQGQKPSRETLNYAGVHLAWETHDDVTWIPEVSGEILLIPSPFSAQSAYLLGWLCSKPMTLPGKTSTYPWYPELLGLSLVSSPSKLQTSSPALAWENWSCTFPGLQHFLNNMSGNLHNATTLAFCLPVKWTFHGCWFVVGYFDCTVMLWDC